VRRPNILKNMADQLAPHWTGAYGHPVAKTPHMDALAADPVHAEAVAGFAAEAAQRWNSEELRADVTATQKSRRALHAAMEAGAGEARDYNPPRNATQEYVRNRMDWTLAAARYRSPPHEETDR